jgi:hypothetical protein
MTAPSTLPVQPTTAAIVPSADVQPTRRAARQNSLAPAAAMLILGLTGGTDDEWWRIQRNWRVAWLGGRVVYYAVRLVVPMVLAGVLRRWATGRLGRL